MEKRRILIVDNNDEFLALLENTLGRLGHQVIVTAEREKALRRDDLDSFDLIISDLSDAEVKAFKMGAANYLRLPYNRDELRRACDDAGLPWSVTQLGGRSRQDPRLVRTLQRLPLRTAAAASRPP